MKPINRRWVIRHALVIPAGLTTLAPEGVNIPTSHKLGDTVTDSKGRQYTVVNNYGTIVRNS